MSGFIATLLAVEFKTDSESLFQKNSNLGYISIAYDLQARKITPLSIF